MLLSRKIRLKPTPEQEVLFLKHVGASRWAYNYYIAENQRVYDEYLANDKQGKSFLNSNEVKKQITQMKQTTHTWLKELSSQAIAWSVRNAESSYKRWFKQQCGKPKFKSRHKSTPSFYVRHDHLYRKNGGFQGERLGFVKTAEPLPDIPNGTNYSDPHISFDGKYWYLSLSYPVESKQVELTDESLGIDLGVKELAVCSNGKVYKNINKTKKVKKLKKKLRRAQRNLSRKLMANTKGYKKQGKGQAPIFERSLDECKNYQKQKKEIKILNRKLNNIRQNYLHQTTTELVKTKPMRVVMEDLNVQGMMKNKHLAKSIAEQKMYEFKRQMQYKCELYGIEFVIADRFYPSSKTCSCCGYIKSDLKLSDRIYKCDACGLVLDRDYNASLNLAKYQSA